MASGSQIRLLGRFLYTQNPFYLISCFLILYGLQIATIARGDLLTRSTFLSASIAAYTLLMAIICVGVVRIGKVWEDARSIFLVVIISLVALSAALDELSIVQWNSAALLLGLAYGFTVLVTETVRRKCGLSFPFWYALSYYTMMGVFFATPLVLGDAVHENHITRTNWGATLFSVAIGVALLLMIPAVRKPEGMVAHSGSPWRWPWYPLTAFGILVVLAAIRVHAVWMSFGFIGAPVQFEPFLILPIAFAVLALMVAMDADSPVPSRAHLAMGLAPLMFLGGVTRGGMTHLPIQAELQWYFGSAETIALVLILGFYCYTWTQRRKGSEFAVMATLIAMYGLSDLPRFAETLGVRHWIFMAVASVLSFVVCLRHQKDQSRLLSFATIVAATILACGHEYGRTADAAIMAAGFSLIAWMTIGAIFDTELARMLRHGAAVISIVAVIALVGLEVTRSLGWIAFAAIGGLAVLSILYMQIVRRWGWLHVFACQSACLLGLLAWTSYETGSISETTWPVPSGLACLAIGLTITSMKTGVHRRVFTVTPEQKSRWGPYQDGL